MSFKSISASMALGPALALALACGASWAWAEESANQDGQTPPEKPKCVSSNTGFKEKGNAATIEIELLNSCDMRLKCTVDAFVIGARGQVQGHRTLILPAAAKGQTTRKAYAMKVRSAGGMANVSHSCRSL